MRGLLRVICLMVVVLSVVWYLDPSKLPEGMDNDISGFVLGFVLSISGYLGWKNN